MTTGTATLASEAALKQQILDELRAHRSGRQFSISVGSMQAATTKIQEIEALGILHPELFEISKKHLEDRGWCVCICWHKMKTMVRGRSPGAKAGTRYHFGGPIGMAYYLADDVGEAIALHLD
jgi:hypothetical protein